MNFYQQGQYTALEKLGQAGLLSRAASSIANTARGGAARVSEGWKNLPPDHQSLVANGILGGGIGGVAGSMDSTGLGGGASGALLGTLAGAGSMAGGAALGQRLARGGLPKALQGSAKAREAAERLARSPVV